MSTMETGLQTAADPVKAQHVPHDRKIEGDSSTGEPAANAVCGRKNAGQRLRREPSALNARNGAVTRQLSEPRVPAMISESSTASA